MSWISVSDFQHPNGWRNSRSSAERAQWYCQQLEQGQILFFSTLPFALPEGQQEFLRSQHQVASQKQKNISYRPAVDKLRGVRQTSSAELSRFQEIMREYSRQVTQFLTEFLTPYTKHWTVDLASLRLLEEEGRDLPLHQRNDLLHVDAFPTRPTQGGRILRVFTNINLDRPRVWNTTDRFEALAQRFAHAAGLPQLAVQESSLVRKFRRQVNRLASAMGTRTVNRSPYDHFMLRFHNYLKESTNFQRECAKICLAFPPQATWIVFTDAVPHAVLSGQFALEQTYIVPLKALLLPDQAPIRILERLCGRRLS
ncbi:MAG: Kdo hydroxylase family protein [Deltaproteobacteria bacterium]|nr:Kdo hydroxylase family protein [Deltaproteobacteria bacterium]